MRNLKIFFNYKLYNETLIGSDLIVPGKRESDSLHVDHLNLFCMCRNILYSVTRDDVVQLYDFCELFVSQNYIRAVNMWYNDIHDTICVCFESGAIISLEMDFSGVIAKKEYYLGCPIFEINWSPDEQLAIVSSGRQLFLVNSELVTVSEVDVTESSTGELKPISIGWGKKETQFHGSEGKEAIIEKSHHLSSFATDRTLRTTWRGDSSLFAVGFWSEVDQMRRIKVFNNVGTLQCVCEEVGIGEPLSWKHQGNLITFCQQLPNKHVISFIEKNGLKHGDFTIPKNVKVKDIDWNEASTILCTVCENLETHSEEVLLWTTGNHHWYLKQQLQLNFITKKVWWDKVQENRLYILGDKGLHILEWIFTVNNSYNSSVEEGSYVAVIDGEKILMTSFKESVIPPPFSSFELHLNKAVNQVFFPPSNCSVKPMLLCAVLCDGSVALFSDHHSEPQLASDFSLKEPCLSLYHWEWAARNTLICCYSERGETILLHLELNGTNIFVKNTVKFPGVLMTCSRTSDGVIIQISIGKLMRYNSSTQALQEETFSLLEPCSDIKTHFSGIYSLSLRSRLLKNGSPINIPAVSGNVTSFLLKDDYVLLTTSSHKLILFHYNNIMCIDVSERKLDRGSKLIMTSGNSVILQTPRGNLETVQPRTLTILALGRMLDSKLYKSAMSLMRKQRINLNLIVDHNQKCFIQDSMAFVTEVEPQWITLLITELNNDNVTETLYHKLYNSEHKSNDCLNGNKIDAVCKAILNAMMVNEAHQRKYMLPILSALVKIGEMDKAIKLASNEEALQHLLFVVDVNTLYLEALGAYDLQVALKIAEKSQKDPKEYIPYLNSLRAMEPNYMKYRIDKSLNRLSSALTHLSKCSEEHMDECIDFIRANHLYSFAVKLFKEDNKRLPQVACMYGEYLFEISCYEESGMMFLRGCDSEKAIESFTKAGNWRQCMRIALKENFREKCQKLAQNLSLVLSLREKFDDAAVMHTEWLSDIDKAVYFYIQGKCWDEAIYTAEKHNKPELLGSIKLSLMESSTFLMESISETRNEVDKYVSRLQIVRIEKQNQPARFYDDFSGASSDTSSYSSAHTKSFLSSSSKNKKKYIRKMWSLKEGNPREEEALVATISQLMQNIEKTIDEVHCSCSALLSFEEDEIAANLQAEMKNLINLINSSTRVVWPNESKSNESAKLDDKYKYPPDITIKPGWEFEILNCS